MLGGGRYLYVLHPSVANRQVRPLVVVALQPGLASRSRVSRAPGGDLRQDCALRRHRSGSAVCSFGLLSGRVTTTEAGTGTKSRRNPLLRARTCPSPRCWQTRSWKTCTPRWKRSDPSLESVSHRETARHKARRHGTTEPHRRNGAGPWDSATPCAKGDHGGDNKRADMHITHCHTCS